jgi:hypothetical protein
MNQNELLETIRAKSLSQKVSDLPHWKDVPAIYPVIEIEKINQIEQSNGFTLPVILKRIYTEIGNGGQNAGPAIMGIACKDDPRQNPPDEELRGWEDDCLEFYKLDYAITIKDESYKVLPFCEKGDNMWYCAVLDNASFPIYVYDGSKAVYDEDEDEYILDDCWIYICESIDVWFESWTRGTSLDY